MQLIKNNPYRLLGLPANASERELQKQLAIIKRFAEVKQSKSFDYDFIFLGPLVRNEGIIKDAANKIEQATNKIFYALHWFINYNHIDDTAIGYLKQNNADKAIEIWDKLVNASPINENNFNAYLNLSTIILGHKSLNGSVNLENLERGVQLKLSLLSSNVFEKFSSEVGGEISTNKSDYYIEKFIDEILNVLIRYSKQNKITVKQIIDTFSKLPGNAKNIALNKFSSDPIKKLDDKVEHTTQERKKNPKNGSKLGEKLFLDCRDQLHNLKSILGLSSLQYQSIANKVASEILQCSIEYFNAFQNDFNFDPGSDCYRLNKYANGIAVSVTVKHRIKEGLEYLTKWEQERPTREVYNKINAEVEFIVRRLESIKNPGMSDAVKTLEICGPKLIEIKKKLGISSSVYLQWCDIVVGNVMGIAVMNFNKEIEISTLLYSPSTNLKNITYQAHTLLRSLESYDMSPELRSRLSQNLITIKIANDKLNPTGCFIATLVYGDYNHPQVQVLRAFRDNTLLKSYLGKKFVIKYYVFSPAMVKKIKNKPFVRIIIRNILNAIIKVIK